MSSYCERLVNRINFLTRENKTLRGQLTAAMEKLADRDSVAAQLEICQEEVVLLRKQNIELTAKTTAQDSVILGLVNDIKKTRREAAFQEQRAVTAETKFSLLEEKKK